MPDQLTPPATSRTVPRASKVHDVCIIGAGPHGLAMLSALHSPGARMTDMQRENSPRKFDKINKPKMQVCVVDGDPWLGAWHRRFEALGIKWLRSPAIAHPSAYDDALIEFAQRTGRTNELRDLELHSERLHGLRNSKDSKTGGSNNATHMRGLWQAHTGLYALPSQALFRDFCAQLADSLPHDFVQSRALKITHHPSAAKEGEEEVEGAEELMEVLLGNGARVWARHLVLAVGAAGPPTVPSSFKSSASPHVSTGGLDAREGVPSQQLLHSSEWHRFHEIEKGDRVLVVGECYMSVKISASLLCSMHLHICPRLSPRVCLFACLSIHA